MSELKSEVRFWKFVDKTDTCWLWTGCVQRYGQFAPHQSRAIKAHRFSWIIHYGQIPEGMHVLHRCDNPPCVNPEHLFLGTHKDNMADMVSKGRQTLGEDNPSAKLKGVDVRAIRNRCKEGFSGKQLSEVFRVSRSTIYAIKNRHIWKHI